MKKIKKVTAWIICFTLLFGILGRIHSPMTVEAATTISSEMYENCKPYLLQDSTIEETASMGGYVYEDVIKCNLDPWSSPNVGFNLQGIYKNLSFEVGHIDGTGLANKNIVMEIYMDGECVEEYPLNVNDIPKKITCNVEGVNQFEIKFTFEYFTGVKGYFGIGAMEFEKVNISDKLVEEKSSSMAENCMPYLLQDSTIEEKIIMGECTYEDGIKCNLDSLHSPNVGFNLQGIYKTLSFEVGHIDGTGLANKNIVMEIYMDGECVEEYPLNVNDIPKKITCNVEDVHQFEIKFSFEYFDGRKGYFGIGAMEFTKKNASDTLVEEKSSNMMKNCQPYLLKDSTIEEIIMGECTYEDGIKCNLDPWHSPEIGFNLRGLYKTIDFEVGHIDGTGLANKNIVMEVYMDGECVKEYPLNVNDIPKKITCNVEGVNQFEIKFIFEYFTGVKGYFGIGALNFTKVISEETKDIELGDLDENQTVELKDAQIVLRMALLLVEDMTEEMEKAADVDENGAVELKDAQQVLRKALLLIDEFEKA